MVEFVGKDDIAAPRQGGQDAQIRGIPRAEQQRLWQTNVFGQTVFKFFMRRHVAGHHVRGTGTESVLF